VKAFIPPLFNATSNISIRSFKNWLANLARSQMEEVNVLLLRMAVIRKEKSRN